MFLIKTAFWLALIIVLLPTNNETQDEIYGSAVAAARDLTTFCVRNPEVCRNSKAALEKFGEKAQFGAKVVMDALKEDKSEKTDLAMAPEAQDPRPMAPLPQLSRQNTLTSEDLQPAWTGPGIGSGI